MLIKGEYNTAIVYASIIDEKSQEQVKTICDQKTFKDSKIRIMPDVHAGKGCTIGTTMTVTDKIVPNLVGVDIGCGMLTVNIGKEQIDFERIDEIAHRIPSGMNVWEAPQEEFDFSGLRCFDKLRRWNWLKGSLGTLGGGNHFIEIDRAADGTNYLVIHSGSRNLGHQVAEYYQRLAMDINKGIETYPAEREKIITEYKAAGREAEIQQALEKISWKNRETTIPENLCFLEGSCMEDYLNDVEICQRFALRSREIMAEILVKNAGLKVTDQFHTIHNYINIRERILRKGAIAAHEGERVLIPVNMRDGSIIAVGKGNADWNYSAPHGAGRIMSRSAAFRTLTLEAYQEQMKGIFTTSVNSATLDEAPMAYKSLDAILNIVKESVEVIDIMKPVYNFKSSEEGFRRGRHL